MSRRWARPAASSSTPSAIRDAPPVSTTMPSALRSSTTSAVGTWATNHRKPPAKARMQASTATAIARHSPRMSRTKRLRGRVAAPAALGPSCRLRESATAIDLRSRSIIAESGRSGGSDKWGGRRSFDRAQGVIDGHARGAGGHRRDQGDQSHDGAIAFGTEREAAEQGGNLLFARGPLEPVAEKAGKQEQQHRGNAADDPALEAEQQEMPLELRGDERVLGADEMQHLDDRAVRRHGAAGGEGHRQGGGGEHQHQQAEADRHRGASHGTHAIDPAAMVVEAG